MRDGSKYMGQVSTHTKGQWYLSKNNLKSNVQHGYGISRWPNGCKYSGTWFNGEANGVGKYTFKSGASVWGFFYNNRATGPCLFTDKNGEQKTIDFNSSVKYFD